LDPGDPQHTHEDAVGLLNAAFGLRDKQDRYTVTLSIKNLTNQFYTTSIDGGWGSIYHRLPLDYKRLLLATFEYRF